MLNENLRILYIFARDAESGLNEVYIGSRPKSHFYRYVKLRENGMQVSFSDVSISEIPSAVKIADSFLNKLFYKSLSLGFCLSKIVMQLKTINKNDVIFCTTDSVGLPALLLRRFGLVKADIIYQSIGLADGWLKSKNIIFRIFLTYLLGAARTVLCYTPFERKLLVKHFKLKDIKVIASCAVAGVDTEYFDKIKVEDGEYVLTVGRDRHRDFSTYIAAMGLTKSKGIIVKTSNCILPGPIGENIKICNDITYPEVVELYRKARCVVVPLTNNSYTAGWVVVGEAMSLGKPIIISKVDAIKGMEDILIHEHNCLMVPCQGVSELQNAILRLNSNAPLRKKLSDNARKKAHEINSRYDNVLYEVFAAGRNK